MKTRKRQSGTEVCIIKNGEIVMTKVKVFIAILMMSVGATAAPITWTGETYTHTGDKKRNMGIDQFDQSGTLVMAVNLGYSAVTLVQNNDDNIVFAAGYNDPSNLSLSNMNGKAFNGWHHTTGGNNWISATARYTTADEDKSAAGSLEFSNLSNGQEYRIQAFIMDGRHTEYGNTVKFDGTNLGQFAFGVDEVTWGDGLLATGTFTADAATQAFDVQVYDDEGTSLGGRLNAVTLYAIPEPASLGLLGIFGAVFLLRRKLMRG
jgi:hypothetical protein